MRNLWSTSRGAGLVHKRSQLIQLGEGGPGIDGLSSQLGAESEIFSEASDDEGGCCVHDNDIARRAPMPLENPADESGVFVRSPATERFKRRPVDAKFLGRNDEVPNAAITNFRNRCFSSKRNFVQPAAMNHEGALHAQFQQSGGHELEGFLRKNPEQLCFSPSRIREWSQ